MASAAKKPVPAKPKKTTGRKTTALTTTNKHLQIVKSKPDAAPASAMTDSFKRKAEALDSKIDKSIAGIDSHYLTLGKLAAEMADGAYFTAIVNPATGDFFKLKTEYFEAKFGKSKSQVFQAQRIVKELTGGDRPIVAESDLRQMTRENANTLTKLKDKGVKITPNIIEKAKTLNAERFQTEIVLPNAPELAQHKAAEQGRVLTGAPTILVRRTITMDNDLAVDYQKAMEIGAYVSRDDNRDDTIEIKALRAILAEFISTHEPEFLVWQDEQKALAQQQANATKNTMVDTGDEYNQGTAAEAEAEAIVDAEMTAEEADELADDVTLGDTEG